MEFSPIYLEDENWGSNYFLMATVYDQEGNRAPLSGVIGGKDYPLFYKKAWA